MSAYKPKKMPPLPRELGPKDREKNSNPYDAGGRARWDKSLNPSKKK